MLLRWRSGLGLLLLVLVVGGCVTRSASPLARYEFQQPHMGTLFTITLYAPDAVSAANGSAAAFQRIGVLNDRLTDYDPESELMRLCAQPAGTPVPVSAELFTVLTAAREISALTGGAFDPTVGPVVRLWRRARRTEALPPPAQIVAAQRRVGWENLHLNPGARTVTLQLDGMQLDLGGIAKGYAADEALRVLRSHGITRALVAASGDIAAGDAPPGQRGWRVSIGTPFQSAGPEQVLTLRHEAVSTSGDSEQFVVINGQRYSHIVDPRTGVGLTNRCQVTVRAARATWTDALATAISISGPQAAAAWRDQWPPAWAVVYTETTNGIRRQEFRSGNFR